MERAILLNVGHGVFWGLCVEVIRVVAVWKCRGAESVRGDARVPFFNRDVRCVLFLFLHALAPPAAGTGAETGAGTEGLAAALSTAPWVAQVSGTSSFSMIIPMVGSFLEEIEEPPAA